MIRTEELVRRVEAGEKTADIATALGACPKVIAKRISHARHTGKLAKKGPRQTVESRILSLAKEGKGSTEIAETLSLNKKSVQVKMSELRTRGVLPPVKRVRVNDSIRDDVLRLSNQAFEPHEIANRLGVQKRTVYAVKQALRDAGELAPHAPAVAVAGPVLAEQALASPAVDLSELFQIPARHGRRVTEEREPRTDGLIDLLGLTSRTCRWPIGESGTPAFGFCGDEVQPGCGSYCSTHRLRAYARPEVRAKIDRQLNISKPKRNPPPAGGEGVAG